MRTTAKYRNGHLWRNLLQLLHSKLREKNCLISLLLSLANDTTGPRYASPRFACSDGSATHACPWLNSTRPISCSHRHDSHAIHLRSSAPRSFCCDSRKHVVHRRRQPVHQKSRVHRQVLRLPLEVFDHEAPRALVGIILCVNHPQALLLTTLSGPLDEVRNDALDCLW